MSSINRSRHKILLITTWDRHIGGVQTYLSLLIKHLRLRNHKTILFQTSKTERWITKLATVISFIFYFHTRPINLSDLHNFTIKPKWLHIRTKCFSLFFTPDLIAAQDPLAVLVARKVFPDVPIVQTIHGPLYEHAKEGGRSSQALEHLWNIELASFKVSDGIIAVDTGQAELALQKGAEINKVNVLYNAVDIDDLMQMSVSNRFSCEALLLNKHITKPYLLIARRLVPKNGVRYAILGFHQSRWVHNSLLVVAGMGVEMDFLRSLTKELGIEDRVLFLGSVPRHKLIPIMAGASISIIPSVPYEGVIEATSLTALESLALGIPTICSNIGGLAEINGNSDCISLVPPSDPFAIAEKINVLMEEPLLAKQQAEHGRHRISEAFGTTRWIEKMLQLYQEVSRAIR